MRFRITGRVVDKETGRGVRGLVVRAYDRDPLFDDLLGTAVTDEDGRFETRYGEEDYAEPLEREPEVYLKIFAPPARLLLSTKQVARLRTGEDQHFEVQIDHSTLGGTAPDLPDGVVEGRLKVRAEDVVVQARDGFHIPRIPGFSTGGAPGAPAVPEQARFAAVPAGARILGVEVQPGQPVRLATDVNPFPAQEPVPDEGWDPERRRGIIQVRFTPLDPAFAARGRYPERLVELGRVEEMGGVQFATVYVRPLQYDPRERAYLFYPDLRYILRFDPESADREPRRLGEHRAELMNAVLSQSIVDVSRGVVISALVPEEYPHLIITDNHAWPESVDRGDGTTRAPTPAERGAALAGDPVAELERLAEWKSSRGMRSRVVTVTQIVDGTLGDFTEDGFARDLQEVIRNFLKHAHSAWGTLYVLLGGDVHVVPMRHLVGSGLYGTFGCGRRADNPPPRTTCHVLPGGTVKLHPQFVPGAGEALSTYHGGVRIPFDREAGPGRLGWYYTTEADFNFLDTGFARRGATQPTEFVIVQGPPALLDDDFYWVRDENSIPSDFYYASLEGPHYSLPGRHDFDINNNGLYAQSHWTAGVEPTLDGVDMASDVWVGRVPLDSGAHARGFVDKVITYERLRAPGGEPVDAGYLGKVLYAADYFGRAWHWRQDDASTPPAENHFTHQAGAALTKLHLDFNLDVPGGVPSRRLVARTGTTQVVIPFDAAAGPATLGWYFATSDSYAVQSATPTRFVAVRGPEAEINPEFLWWDPITVEGAMAEKEYLRSRLDQWYSSFTTVSRHYSDYFELGAPPPIVPLEEPTVRAALDEGWHFVSLTGHGWWGGCCGISVYTQPNFANARRYSVMYAHSCSTARPDGADSLGEVSVLDPDGGAVGYVGNTRYGWVGVGDNFEEFFWCMLRACGRLGPAAGMRLATDGVKSLWSAFTQTLYGDPEMPVWTGFPEDYEVSLPRVAEWGGSFSVTVRRLGVPLEGHRVTVLGGWRGSALRPRVLVSKHTGADGRATFQLPSSGSPLASVRVTVAEPGYRPFVAELPISGGLE